MVSLHVVSIAQGRFVAFHTEGPEFDSQSKNMFPVFICNNKKGKATWSKCQMNADTAIIFVKLRVVLGVLGMLSPNLASILGYLCSLRRYLSFFVGTLDSCFRFLKHITFLVGTRQTVSDRQTSKMSQQIQLSSLNNKRHNNIIISVNHNRQITTNVK